MERRTPRWGSDMLVSPVFALAVVVLVVNDHVLKALVPGRVTGKLSDVAGVAMVAIVLTVVLGSRAIGWAATAVGFAALKSIESVAVAASPILGGVTRTDRTDVLALAVLVPLWWWSGRRRTWSHAPATLLVPMKLLAIGVAVLATSATSCSEEGVHAVVADSDGTLLADTSSGTFRSGDGGQTWTTTDAGFEFGSDVRRACVGDGMCFEVDGSSVVRIADGRRSTEFALTPEEIQGLNEVSGSECGGQGYYFASVAAVERPDGAHVVVSMTTSGAIHRSPDGTWRWVRIGRFGSAAAVDSPAAPTQAAPPTTSLLGVTVPRWILVFAPIVVALAAIPLGLTARGSHAGVTGVLVLTFGLAVLLVSWSGVFLVFSSLNDQSPAALVGAVVAVAAGIGGLVGLTAMARRPPVQPVPAAGNPADWPPPAAQ